MSRILSQQIFTFMSLEKEQRKLYSDQGWKLELKKK